jgi:uncharacterized MAPEG superfamily protein
MQTELGILALFGVLIILTIAIQAVFSMAQNGIMYLVGPRDEARALSGIGSRLERAARNNIETVAYFAPAVLLLDAQGTGTATTLFAAQVFLVARLLYVPAYASGIPVLRTMIWAVGLCATLYLYAVALL